ncbi:uncharacterized protein MYCGRDRAFT_95938 [Zymoseptoria tritici IPO323]|uniref:Uncharacterized protein n=2 Tax=Zymoseptoria tritici TaxID=1047171 RepID=F9XK61_ZYMTI|nr:uncharacterized protein MYCGRDRAFT_95938 [Zymoseptoria tritici IPO323]EGP84500.1 hypothetical protein MYCGRDRAFT_95938 [Zymoseptoria tritici IPO323]
MANKTNKRAEQSQAKPEQPTWQLPDDVKNNGEVWSYHYPNKMWFYYDFKNSKYISVRFDGQRFSHPAPPPSKKVAPSSSAAPSLTQAAQRKRSHSESSPPLMHSDGNHRRKSMKTMSGTNGSDQQDQQNQHDQQIQRDQDNQLDIATTGEPTSWPLPQHLKDKNRTWMFQHDVRKWCYWNARIGRYILVDQQGNKSAWVAPPPTPKQITTASITAPASSAPRSSGQSASAEESPLQQQQPQPQETPSIPLQSQPRAAPPGNLAAAKGCHTLLGSTTAAPRSDFSSVLRTSSPSRWATAAEIADFIDAKAKAKTADTKEAERKPVNPES